LGFDPKVFSFFFNRGFPTRSPDSSMKITNAAFVRSVSDLSDLPEETFPEIVFAGRS